MQYRGWNCVARSPRFQHRTVGISFDFGGGEVLSTLDAMETLSDLVMTFTDLDSLDFALGQSRGDADDFGQRIDDLAFLGAAVGCNLGGRTSIHSYGLGLDGISGTGVRDTRFKSALASTSAEVMTRALLAASALKRLFCALRASVAASWSMETTASAMSLAAAADTWAAFALASASAAVAVAAWARQNPRWCVLRRQQWLFWPGPAYQRPPSRSPLLSSLSWRRLPPCWSLLPLPRKLPHVLPLASELRPQLASLLPLALSRRPPHLLPPRHERLLWPGPWPYVRSCTVTPFPQEKKLYLASIYFLVIYIQRELRMHCGLWFSSEMYCNTWRVLVRTDR